MSISKNTTYNFAGAFVPMLLALLTIPVYLDLVGVERYGTLAIAWLILGYFNLFDLGLARATAHRIAALGDDTAQSRSNVFWTAAMVNIGIGLIGGIILYFAASYFFGNFFKASDTLLMEVGEALPFLALAVPIITLSGVASGALQGRERFLEINIVTIIATSLFQLLPLAAAYFIGPTLKWLILAAIFARIIGLSLFCFQVYRHLLVGLRPNIDRSQWTGLLKYGGWISATAIIGPLMIMSDRFMIGGLVSAAAVAIYAVAFDLVQRILVLPRALGTAIFPRIAAKDEQAGGILAGKALSALTLVISPAILSILYLIHPFLSIWVGGIIAHQAAPVAIILLLGFWITALATIPYTKLQAIGRPDLVMKALLFELPFYLIAMYFGITHAGLIGAAIVYSVRALIDYLILSWLSETQVIFSLPITAFATLLFSSALLVLYTLSFSIWWWAGLAISMLASMYFITRNVPVEMQAIIETKLPNILTRYLKYIN